MYNNLKRITLKEAENGRNETNLNMSERAQHYFSTLKKDAAALHRNEGLKNLGFGNIMNTQNDGPGGREKSPVEKRKKHKVTFQAEPAKHSPNLPESEQSEAISENDLSLLNESQSEISTISSVTASDTENVVLSIPPLNTDQKEPQKGRKQDDGQFSRSKADNSLLTGTASDAQRRGSRSFSLLSNSELKDQLKMLGKSLDASLAATASDKIESSDSSTVTPKPEATLQRSETKKSDLPQKTILPKKSIQKGSSPFLKRSLDESKTSPAESVYTENSSIEENILEEESASSVSSILPDTHQPEEKSRKLARKPAVSSKIETSSENVTPRKNGSRKSSHSSRKQKQHGSHKAKKAEISSGESSRRSDAEKSSSSKYTSSRTSTESASGTATSFTSSTTASSTLKGSTNSSSHTESSYSKRSRSQNSSSTPSKSKPKITNGKNTVRKKDSGATSNPALSVPDSASFEKNLKDSFLEEQRSLSLEDISFEQAEDKGDFASATQEQKGEPLDAGDHFYSERFSAEMERTDFFELPLYHEMYLRLVNDVLPMNDEKNLVSRVLHLHVKLIREELDREMRALREWDRLMNEVERSTDGISFSRLRQILRGDALLL